MIFKMGKWMFSTRVPGKLEIQMLKNEAENLPLTIYKHMKGLMEWLRVTA